MFSLAASLGNHGVGFWDLIKDVFILNLYSGTVGEEKKFVQTAKTEFIFSLMGFSGNQWDLGFGIR